MVSNPYEYPTNHVIAIIHCIFSPSFELRQLDLKNLKNSKHLVLIAANQLSVTQLKRNHWKIASSICILFIPWNMQQRWGKTLTRKARKLARTSSYIYFNQCSVFWFAYILKLILFEKNVLLVKVQKFKKTPHSSLFIKSEKEKDGYISICISWTYFIDLHQDNL